MVVCEVGAPTGSARETPPRSVYGDSIPVCAATAGTAFGFRTHCIRMLRARGARLRPVLRIGPAGSGQAVSVRSAEHTACPTVPFRTREAAGRCQSVVPGVVPERRLSPAFRWPDCGRRTHGCRQAWCRALCPARAAATGDDRILLQAAGGGHPRVTLVTRTDKCCRCLAGQFSACALKLIPGIGDGRCTHRPHPASRRVAAAGI